MRITGGEFLNRRLQAPLGNQVRPSTDRTREALFNRLATRLALAECSVLDLFAGSGALGLEALSRGADHATFVDNSERSLSTVRQNIKVLCVEEQSRVVRADALNHLSGCAAASITFDLILADPPYNYSDLDALIDLAVGRLHEEGYFVLEHDRVRSFEDHSSFVVDGSYGKTTISFFTLSVR